MEKCKTCFYCEHNCNFGYICQHKASMEGIEAEKNFYLIDEVTDCNYYDTN